MMARITGSILPEDTWRMEQFSKAYVKAVASVAECSIDWSSVDNDSVDGTLKRRTHLSTVRSPYLDIQLKSTYTDCIQDNHIVYPLSIKNYDDLRTINLSVPRILVVVVLPSDLSEWTYHNEQQLALRKCGYWMSLRGEPATINTTSKTVHLPRQQVFDVNGLDAIFNDLENGVWP
jgi:hypothetical protein